MRRSRTRTPVLDTLRDLVNERLVLLTASGVPALGDPGAGVTTLAPYPDHPDRALPVADPGVTRLVVRSWRGTHDSRAEFPPATPAP